jgi:hypothetical protein
MEKPRVPVGYMSGEVQRLTQQQRRLIQVNDARPKARPEHELTHPAVQRARFVTHVHARIKQILHCEQSVHAEVVMDCQRVEIASRGTFL